MFYFFLVTVFIFSCGQHPRTRLLKEKSVESFGKDKSLKIDVDVDLLQKRLGYKFKDKQLLRTTLNNPSFANRDWRGDKLLNSAIAEKVGEMSRYSSPGYLNTLFESYKGNNHLQKVANNLGLKLTNNSYQGHNTRTYGNIVEAILCAIKDDMANRNDYKGNINDIIFRITEIDKLKSSPKEWKFCLDDFKNKKDIISLFQKEFADYTYAWNRILSLKEDDFAFNIFQMFCHEAFDLYPYLISSNGKKNELSFIPLDSMDYCTKQEYNKLCEYKVIRSDNGRKFEVSYPSYAKDLLESCKNISKNGGYSKNAAKVAQNESLKKAKKDSISNFAGMRSFFSSKDIQPPYLSFQMTKEEFKKLAHCSRSSYSSHEGCTYGECGSCDKKFDEILFPHIKNKFPNCEYLFSALKNRADLFLIYLEKKLSKRHPGIKLSLDLEKWSGNITINNISYGNDSNFHERYSNRNFVPSHVEGVTYFENASKYVDRVIIMQEKMEEEELELRVKHNCYSPEISSEIKKELDIFAKNLMQKEMEKVRLAAKKDSSWLKLKELKDKIVGEGLSVQLNFVPQNQNSKSEARYSACLVIIEEKMPKDLARFLMKVKSQFFSNFVEAKMEEVERFFEYILPGTKPKFNYLANERRIVIKGTNK